MNISPSSLYNEILNDIQSRISFPINFGVRSAANPALGKDTGKITETPVDTNVSFNSILSMYVNNVRDSVDTELSATIENAIVESAQKYQLDPNLIKAVIRQESNFNPTAVSSAGAQGLMQLMPTTASGLGVTNAFDIDQNIEGGAKYLSQMLDKFDGDEQLALAAYNAGPGSVAKYDGIPPYAETQSYVPKVLGYREQYLIEQYNKNKTVDLDD